MSTQFGYDVLISHSSKDKSRRGGMRELAKRDKSFAQRPILIGALNVNYV
jgi:hypothetical protein